MLLHDPVVLHLINHLRSGWRSWTGQGDVGAGPALRVLKFSAAMSEIGPKHWEWGKIRLGSIHLLSPLLFSPKTKMVTAGLCCCKSVLPQNQKRCLGDAKLPPTEERVCGTQGYWLPSKPRHGCALSQCQLWPIFPKNNSTAGVLT